MARGAAAGAAQRGLATAPGDAGRDADLRPAEVPGSRPCCALGGTFSQGESYPRSYGLTVVYGRYMVDIRYR